MSRKPIVGVFGGGADKTRDDDRNAARLVGYATIVNGAVLLTGGLPASGDDIKDVAMRGAASAAGEEDVPARLIGVLTSKDSKKSLANIQPRYQRLIKTDLINYRRNPVNGFTPDAAVILQGGAGTLAELGFALAANRPCYFVGSAERLWAFLQANCSEVRDVIGVGLTQYQAFEARALTVQGIFADLDRCLRGRTDDLSMPVDLDGALNLIARIMQEIPVGGLARDSGFPGVAGVLSKQCFEDWLKAMP